MEPNSFSLVDNASTQLLFFSDQSVQGENSLRSLVHQAKHCPAVQHFLDEAISLLCREILHLPEDECSRFPVFRTTLDLLDYAVANGNHDVVLSTVLLCINQLGHLILCVERDPSILHLVSGSPQRHIVGLCTGLLPAVAAATTSSLSELCQAAPIITSIAFRLGLHAYRRARQIDAEVTGCWAVAIIGITDTILEPILDLFHANSSVPTHNRAYISAASGSSLTISGPPGVLKQLLQSELLAPYKKHWLPIHAPFHAPHLPVPHVADIVGTHPLLKTAQTSANTALLSPHSGNAYEGSNAYELLQECLPDIFQNQLFPSKAFESAAAGIASSRVKLSLIGPTSSETTLWQALNKAEVQVERTIQPDLDAEDVAGSIAIVGMAGRFPGSEDLESFWDHLKQGDDLHTTVPPDRFDIGLHCDPLGVKKNTTASAFGCFIDNPGHFDARLFNMSPREARQTDPAHRLLLMTTYEALETAGYRGDMRPDQGRVGTFVGITGDDWRECNLAEDIDIYYVTGGSRAFGPGRLNYHFKWDGPSYAVDTACSSSGAAIELACASLLDGKCDMAVAGGANVITGPNMYAGLSRAGFLSTTGSCKTFDDGADGYCRGDGVAVLVLKRLSDAIHQRDNIRGVIRSVATNHSAHAASITQPHTPAQRALYQQVLRKAGLKSDQINYIEMHGTGTQIGDATEMNSVISTFGSGRSRAEPLYIGGIKANIGHGEGAAGATSVIKSALMLREGCIPPHVGIKHRLNSKFPPLDVHNIRIAHSPVPFPETGEPKRVLVGSFGASGGNTCMIVEEPPKTLLTGSDPRSHHVVTISAKTHNSLNGNKQRLLEYLRLNPATQVQHVAYTTTARRTHHPLRSSFCVPDTNALINALSADLELKSIPQRPAPRSIVFTFPGQGAKYAGIAATLYDTCEPFAREISQLEAICQALSLPSFVSLLRHPSTDLSTISPVESHLAIVCLEIALARVLQRWGIVPSLLIGHSLGEYAALCIAGVLTTTDTLFLVGKRAELIQKHCTTAKFGMLAIQASETTTRSLLQSVTAQGCEISCLNSPTSTVISGNIGYLERTQSEIKSTRPDIRTFMVDVPYAFHSSQVDPILDEFEKVATSVHFSAPCVPIVSTLLGNVVKEETVFNARYLRDQTRKCVRFEQGLIAAQASGLISDSSLFIEAGPGTICTGLIKSCLPISSNSLVSCLSLNDNCWRAIPSMLDQAYRTGSVIHWSDYHRQYEQSLKLLDLPTYHFDVQDYWIKYSGGLTALLKNGLAASTVPDTAQSIEAPPSKLSTCLHRIESERITEDTAEVKFSSNLQDARLQSLISGHSVLGLALAPSSIYGEMAFAASRYIHSQMHPDTTSPPPMEILNMEIFSALILKTSAVAQNLKVYAVLEPRSETVKIVFSSDQDHARCVIRFGDEQTWKTKWSRSSYLVKERISTITKPQSPQPMHHLLKEMVYHIFNPITTYSQEYWSITEISISRAFDEAVATLDFRATPDDCDFVHDPCWLDGVAQTAGFLLNTSTAKPEDTIMMSTGWDKFSVRNAIKSATRYSCHVHAEEQGAGAGFICDATLISQSGDVVVLAKGLQFKRIKKGTLQRMLASQAKAGDKPLLSRAPPSATAVAPHRAKVDPRMQPVKPETTRKTIQANTSNRDAAKAESFAQVLSVIAEEVGMPVTDLTNGVKLEDLGVDSLLTIAITSKLNDVMNIELPTSLLTGGTTIANLRDHFLASQSSNAGAQMLPQSRIGYTSSDTFDTVINLIASEVGISATDLVDNVTLEDLGLDSLLTIAITSRVNDTVGIELPTELLAGSNTISDLRRYFHDAGNILLDDSSSVSASVVPTPATKQTSSITTDDLSVDVRDILLSSLAYETGIAVAELNDNVPLSDLGVDSLMSIAILNRIKDESGVELPSSLFVSYTTLAELCSAIGRKESQPQEIGTGPTSSTAKPHERPPFPTERYRSNAVLLHGDPQSSFPRLFLIADGAGSAAAYIHFPRFSSSLPTYALESPFLHCPEEFTCSMEELCSIYVRAIQAVQPHGPYLLGGWSFGGMCSYEVARQLIASGESVHGLLLIESACPQLVEGLPEVTIELLNEVGMFVGIPQQGKADKPMPYHQKLHVTRCASAAVNYDPILIPDAKRPKQNYVIWSHYGLFDKFAIKVKEAADGMNQSSLERTGINMDWLEGERTSFGPKGWDRLLGQVECFDLEGTHFSIMHLPRARQTTGPLVAKLVQQYVDQLTCVVANEEHQVHHVDATRRVRAAFEDVRLQYGKFANEAGLSDFWECVYPAQTKLVLAYIAAAFAALGSPLAQFRQGVELPPLNVLPRHHSLLNRIFDILESDGLVTRQGSQVFRTAKPVDTTSADDIYEDLIRRFPRHKALHQLLRTTGSQLADCLVGKADPLKLLFNPGTKSIMKDVYFDTPVFQASTIHLSAFLRKAYLESNERIQILEVGAGLGGTTRYIVDMLIREGIPFTYVFSDMSSSLVAAAKRLFSYLAPGSMEFAVVDIEKTPPPALQNRFHTVISTNCIHATKNITTTSSQVRKLLRPDGFFAINESTERLAVFDLVWGLLEGWWLFEDGRTHAIADMVFWKTSLEAAGFCDIAWTEGTKDEKPVAAVIVGFQCRD